MIEAPSLRQVNEEEEEGFCRAVDGDDNEDNSPWSGGKSRLYNVAQTEDDPKYAPEYAERRNGAKQED